MFFTGTCYPMSPRLYKHECNRCGKIGSELKCYPHIDYDPITPRCSPAPADPSSRKETPDA